MAPSIEQHGLNKGEASPESQQHAAEFSRDIQSQFKPIDNAIKPGDPGKPNNEISRLGFPDFQISEQGTKPADFSTAPGSKPAFEEGKPGDGTQRPPENTSQNPDGTTHSIKYDANGGWTDGKYGADGKLINYTKYGANGKPSEYGNRNSDGTFNQTILGPDGKRAEYVKYGADGQPIEHAKFDADGKMCEYDKKNADGSTEQNKYGADGKQTEQNKFGPDGKPTESTKYGPDGKPTETSKLSPDGKPTETTKLGPDGKPSETTKFGPDGKPTETTKLGPDGKPSETTKFAADGKTPTEQSRYGSDGKPTTVTFDAYGHPTSVIRDGYSQALPAESKNFKWDDQCRPTFQNQQDITITLGDDLTPVSYRSKDYTIERHPDDAKNGGDPNQWYFHQDGSPTWVPVSNPVTDANGRIAAVETRSSILGIPRKSTAHILDAGGERESEFDPKANESQKEKNEHYTNYWIVN